MNQPQSTQEHFRIPALPPIVETLRQQMPQPDQIDAVTDSLHMPAYLLNFYLATPLDLSSIGLGHVINIPVQITDRPGGRKSLFFLQPGEETLAGIYVTSQSIALRYMKRLSGQSIPAQTGDTYAERITNREGIVISQGESRLEMLNPAEGSGRFSPIRPDGPIPSQDEVIPPICFFNTLISVMPVQHSPSELDNKTTGQP